MINFRLAEAEALLVGDDSSISVGGSSAVIIEEVASAFGDASAFALQVSITMLIFRGLVFGFFSNTVTSGPNRI